MSKEKMPVSERQKLDRLEKPMYELTDDELHYLLDVKLYPKANNALEKQRKIWDYSYLAYKGIILQDEINRKRRANGYGIYVNVPRTFATIEGIRKNFNINQLSISVEKTDGTMETFKKAKIAKFLNYDLDRSGTREQIKDAGYDKLVYGNGFIYSFLLDRQGKYATIGDSIGEDGRVKLGKPTQKRLYYGMVGRRISPYNIFPDPDGTTLDVHDNINRLCNYVCIRSVKHIANFKRDWNGIVPDSILSDVMPGGKDMTNYEAVKETVDFLFDYGNLRYPGTLQDFTTANRAKVSYSSDEYVEERLWIGEDFMILQAGKDMKICLVSPNPNPDKTLSLIKLDDVSVPGEFWSMGQPYLLRYQQIEENRIHNSVLDMIHFSISGMVGINTQYLEDPYDLDIYPEKVWKFKAVPGVSINDVMQKFVPDSSSITPALNFMHEVKAIGQQTTSITDFVMGASKSIADTATEANKLSGASDITIVEKIKEMVTGALVSIAKDWLSRYPIVYAGEKMEFADADFDMYFCGEKEDDVTEEKLAELLTEYEPEDIIYLDDIDVTNPKIRIDGDIEISKDVKLRQWSAAINFAKEINTQAFEQNDPRRIDVIQMGIDAMTNFDVISMPEDYLLDNQPTKSDQMNDQAMAGALANTIQQQNGGRPEEGGVQEPRTALTNMRSSAQPENMGMREADNRNE